MNPSSTPRARKRQSRDGSAGGSLVSKQFRELIGNIYWPYIWAMARGGSAGHAAMILRPLDDCPPCEVDSHKEVVLHPTPRCRAKVAIVLAVIAAVKSAF